MASFCSENTLGLILIAHLLPKLHGIGRNVIPIMYWKSREGSRSAEIPLLCKKVKILALFARRPKLTAENNVVVCRINEVLGNFADQAREFNICTIAGFPLARSLDELQLNLRDPLWFPIEPRIYSKDIPLNLHNDFRQLRGFGDIELWTPDKIGQIIEETPGIPWEVAKECLNKLRETLMDGNYFPFGNGYKPIYLLEIDT